MTTPQTAQVQFTQQLVAYVQDYMASVLGLSPAEIDPGARLDALGINSSALMALVGELEERLHVEIAPSALYETTSMREAIEHVVELHLQSARPHHGDEGDARSR
jgi:acyl carrier protein